MSEDPNPLAFISRARVNLTRKNRSLRFVITSLFEPKLMILISYFQDFDIEVEGTRELKLHVYYKSRLNFDEHLAQGKIEVRRNCVRCGPASAAPRLQERRLKPSLLVQ